MKMMVKCPKCEKQYDLIEATRKSKGGSITCPHCKQVVAK